MRDLLVSINCITYNHGKYVSEAIESFLMQKTKFNFEILIHDDASTDNTAKIITDYQKKYPNIIKPILQKENQLSKGIRRMTYIYNHTRSSGKYIALCEGDDYWSDPYKLQKQVDYMQSHPECSLCFHAANIIDKNTVKIGEIKPYNSSCISPSEDIILNDGGFMATNSILYRKSVMDSAPDFFFSAPVGDYPLQILTSIHNYAYYINNNMSVYRANVEGSWSDKSDKENRIEKFIVLRKEIAKMLNEFDKYSNKKFSNVVEKKILKDEIEIMIIKRNMKNLGEPRYKALINTLTLNEKLRLLARCYIPDLYSKLGNIKRALKIRLLYN